MKQRIFNSMYKDVGAVALENDCLEARFLPGNGGKMASLILKKTSREFLIQAKNQKYNALDYDGNYVKSECSGFDDMFPTIDRVHYSDYPWKGVEIPDHGEVCGLEWDCEIREDCLYMAVYGVRFPYRLEKWIRFKSDNVLNINYKATNLCSFDMDFIWAAHPIINAGDGGEIILPYKGQQNAICVFSSDNTEVCYGDLFSWPETVLGNGRKAALNIIDCQKRDNAAYKYYFREKMPEGWCIYRYKSDGTALELSFPKEKVPYLGILSGEDPITGDLKLFLEPCTGAFDRPDIAKMHGQNSVLKARDEYSWYLNFQVT